MMLVRGIGICLLYTSDAADEEDSVDLGGRRIIKNTWDTDEFKWDCDHDLKGYTALCCDCYFELGCKSFYEMGLDC